MNVLVLGASGMLGNAMIRVLSEKNSLKVFGSIRSQKIKKFFNKIKYFNLEGCKT